MPTPSGLTSFGIIRKRMADLYSDFAVRIKESGSFGVQTTADAPDLFPTDPLVQLMTTTSASLAEVWETTEFFFAQLDPRTASGVYLQTLHGTRAGITQGATQTEESYRNAILAALPRPSRNHIETIAAARPDIDCAVLLTSTVDQPIEGITAPGNALVVKGCSPINYGALAADIYDKVELGSHVLSGDIIGTFSPTVGSCISYRFIEAEPLFVAVAIEGYFLNTCGDNAITTVKAAMAAQIAALYSSCGLGIGISSATIATELASFSGFVVTSIRLARRARQLWGIPCTDFSSAPMVMLCGVVEPWISQRACGPRIGEVWCPVADTCVKVKPWEYIIIDNQFVTLTEDATRGGCA